MEGLIESGALELIAGILLLLFAYLLPGIYMTSDNKEGIRLLEEREAAKAGVKPMAWTMFVTAVALWPFVDWARVATHQSWAMYIKRGKENPDDDNSDEQSGSSKEDRESRD